MDDWEFVFVVPISTIDDSAKELGEILGWLQENFLEEYHWDLTYRALSKGSDLCLEISTNHAKDAMLLKLSNPNVIQL